MFLHPPVESFVTFFLQCYCKCFSNKEVAGMQMKYALDSFWQKVDSEGVSLN